MKRSELLELAAGPMGFKEAMFRAVEEGRKTQTRRIVNPQPGPLGIHPAMKEQLIEKAKYQPGGIYYLPEPVQLVTLSSAGDEGEPPYVEGVYLWGTGEQPCNFRANISVQEYEKILARKRGWDAPTTARFMLKSFAREFVRIKSVKVEWLQDITPEDCRDEGMPAKNNDLGVCYAFGSLWNSIHGADAWSANPWVWVYEFEREEVSS